MTLRGIHHVKIAVSNLERSLQFYTDVFGARRIADADHVDDAGRLYACTLDVPGHRHLARTAPRRPPRGLRARL